MVGHDIWGEGVPDFEEFADCMIDRLYANATPDVIIEWQRLTERERRSVLRDAY